MQDSNPDPLPETGQGILTMLILPQRHLLHSKDRPRSTDLHKTHE